MLASIKLLIIANLLIILVNGIQLADPVVNPLSNPQPSAPVLLLPLNTIDLPNNRYSKFLCSPENLNTKLINDYINCRSEIPEQQQTANVKQYNQKMSDIFANCAVGRDHILNKYTNVNLNDRFVKSKILELCSQSYNQCFDEKVNEYKTLNKQLITDLINEEKDGKYRFSKTTKEVIQCRKQLLNLPENVDHNQQQQQQSPQPILNNIQNQTDFPNNMISRALCSSEKLNTKLINDYINCRSEVPEQQQTPNHRQYNQKMLEIYDDCVVGRDHILNNYPNVKTTDKFVKSKILQECSESYNECYYEKIHEFQKQNKQLIDDMNNEHTVGKYRFTKTIGEALKCRFQLLNIPYNG